MIDCGRDRDGANPSVHPYAIESCNPIDDDCDGQADEDALGVDVDGDGIRNACDDCRSANNPDRAGS